MDRWTGGQTDTQINVCVWGWGALLQVHGRIVSGLAYAPRTVCGPLYSCGEVAGTQAALFEFRAVCVGLSCSGIRRCDGGLWAFHYGPPSQFQLWLLRAEKWTYRDQPGRPGLQELGEAEKAVRVSGRNECPSEELGGVCPWMP